MILDEGMVEVVVTVVVDVSWIMLETDVVALLVGGIASEYCVLGEGD